MAYFVLPMMVFGLLPPAVLIFFRQRMVRSTSYFLTTLRFRGIGDAGQARDLVVRAQGSR
jgi:hypothetical protein